jgi:hypothetical protein
MTSAPTAEATTAPADTLTQLLANARQAGRALRQHPRPDTAPATRIAEMLSDQVGDAARAIGVDTADGWRLLDLRDRLDSHVLAVAALDGTGVRDAVVLDVIGRAVIDVVVRLSTSRT